MRHKREPQSVEWFRKVRVALPSQRAELLLTDEAVDAGVREAVGTELYDELSSDRCQFVNQLGPTFTVLEPVAKRYELVRIDLVGVSYGRIVEEDQRILLDQLDAPRFEVMFTECVHSL